MIDRLSDTLTNAQSQLAGLVAGWTQSKRLYNVSGDGPVNELLVEQFSLIDSISEPDAAHAQGNAATQETPPHLALTSYKNASGI